MWVVLLGLVLGLMMMMMMGWLVFAGVGDYNNLISRQLLEATIAKSKQFSFYYSTYV